MKKSKTFVLISLLLFLIKFPVFSDGKSADKSVETEETIVYIESAKKTEYKKIEEEEVVIFTGDVKLSVSKPSQEIYIEADNVTFNRNRSTIYAEGNVVFTELGKGKDESQESLTASSLLFNTETMEGVFDSARVIQETSDNINLANGTTLIVSSEIFGKENSGTVTFKSGTLTFCDDDNPHWKIKASRIWLLPGNEFSFFNALLYVGNLPIFYMPFFYYPKDEMIFNPVFGYRPREGYFVQTTTYLVGRKPLAKGSNKSDEESGLFDFMKTTELKEQKREGLFLVNQNEKATMPKNYLKILGDVYSNLGGMVGIDGKFENLGIINNLKFSTYLGFSNTIFNRGENHFSSLSPTGKTYYNTSYIFDKKVPFRYFTNFELSISKAPFSLSVNLPLYSDRLFKNDFLNRSEDMDWISFLLDDNQNAETKISEISSYSWNINGSIGKPKFLSLLSPYVENLSLSSFSSSVNFLSKQNTTVEGENSLSGPEKSFFYPASVYPVKASISLSGNLISYSSEISIPKSSNKKSSSEIDFSDKLENPLEEKKETDNNSQKNISKENQEESTEFISDTFIPQIKTSTSSINKIRDFKYNLSYNIKPSVSTEVDYFYENFKSPEDIDLSNIKTLFLSLKSPIKLQNDISYKNDLLTLSNSFDFTANYQNHPIINEEYAEKNVSKVTNIKKSDFNSRKIDLSNTNSLRFKPFIFVEQLKAFSVSWNTSFDIIESKFLGDVEEPQWEYKIFEWTDDYIKRNNLSASFTAKQLAGTVSETVTFTANLPPLPDTYNVKLGLSFPFCKSFQISMGYKQKSKTDETWVFEPIIQTSSWGLFDGNLSISESFKYNLEEKYVENFTTSIKGLGITASYVMSYTNPFTFSLIDGTWIKISEKEFLPYELRFSYSMNAKTYTVASEKVKIAPTLSTELKFDLIQFTDCYFSFSPGIKIDITDFLSFSFSSESRNNVIYRYVQDWFDIGIEMPGETNVFKDLLNSFAFWDNSLRQSSGFKLKKLKMTLSHNLHDWTLNSSYTLEPRLVKTSTPYYYDFSPYFTLSVVWNPMNSLKTTVEDKYGEFILY